MIIHASITEQIVSYMKEQIESGAWKAGEKIPSENTLTKELGVSRASVRDAIRYFAGQGVLESRHGKGTYLLEKKEELEPDPDTTITAEDFENIEAVLEYRRITESEGCYLAALKMDEEMLSLLRYQLSEMEKQKENRVEFLEADLEFHRIIAKASGNPFIAKTLNMIFLESFNEINRMYDIFTYENGIRFHRLITAELEKGDADGARRAMYEHMQASIDQLKKM